ncbi:hypothetical protein AB0C10_36600 [Microbispora amethystogenes]
MAVKRCGTCAGSGKVERMFQGEFRQGVIREVPCDGPCLGQGWITIPDND